MKHWTHISVLLKGPCGNAGAFFFSFFSRAQNRADTSPREMCPSPFPEKGVNGPRDFTG